MQHKHTSQKEKQNFCHNLFFPAGIRKNLVIDSSLSYQKKKTNILIYKRKS